MNELLIKLFENKNICDWDWCSYNTIKNLFNMYYFKDFQTDYKLRKILLELIKNKDMKMKIINKRYYYKYKELTNKNEIGIVNF